MKIAAIPNIARRIYSTRAWFFIFLDELLILVANLRGMKTSGIWVAMEIKSNVIVMRYLEYINPIM